MTFAPFKKSVLALLLLLGLTANALADDATTETKVDAGNTTANADTKADAKNTTVNADTKTDTGTIDMSAEAGTDTTADVSADTSTSTGVTVDSNGRRVMNPKDPYEPFNRVVYRFNDVLDRAIMKPIATLYNKIVPKPLVKGIANFYQNIDTIPTVCNDVLQFNFYQATSDAWRLTLNSTIGIVGFFDVATDMGLDPNKEDFGLTLAQWGYKKSNYLVLPFFGPNTPRDAIGIPVDYYVFSIYPHIYPTIQRYELYGLGVVSRRAELLSYENVMEQAALDKYVFLRDAYMQRRAYLIQRNTELGNPYLEKNNSNNEDKESS